MAKWGSGEASGAPEFRLAIDQIGKDNLAGAAQLTSALNNMADALKSSTPSVAISEDVSKTEGLAKEFDAMKDDIASIKGTMNAILGHLKKK